MVRNSARPDETVVTVSSVEWRAFVTMLKEGTFDRL